MKGGDGRAIIPGAQYTTGCLLLGTLGQCRSEEEEEEEEEEGL